MNEDSEKKEWYLRLTKKKNRKSLKKDLAEMESYFSEVSALDFLSKVVIFELFLPFTESYVKSWCDSHDGWIYKENMRAVMNGAFTMEINNV